MRLKSAGARLARLEETRDRAALGLLRRTLLGSRNDPIDALCWLFVSYNVKPLEAWEPPADCEQRAAEAWARILKVATPRERRILRLPLPCIENGLGEGGGGGTAPNGP
jgi:hypothetical protein